MHLRLLQHMTALGYQGHDAGACAGIAEMGMLAFLCGKTEFEKYRTRFKRLSKLQPSDLAQIKELRQAKQSLTEEQIDILAFFEGVELYLLPGKYRDLFGRHVQQSEARSIYPLHQPDMLVKQGGAVEIASTVGIYNHEELNQWFGSLDTAIKEHAPGVDFCLSLSCDSHRIGLCYQAESQSWFLIDANFLVRLNQSLKVSEFTDIIFSRFEDTINSVFSTSIVTTGNNQETLENILTDWNKDPVITEETVRRCNARDVTLAYIAAQNGDVGVLRQLLKKGANPNQAGPGGSTSVFIAAFHGHVEVLRLLAENGANLNLADSDGILPAHVAAYNGHIEVLGVLAENGVDLNSQSDVLLRYLRKYHPYPEQFISELSNSINKEITKRMPVVNLLNRFIVDHKNETQYLEYRQQLYRLDEYAQRLLCIKDQLIDQGQIRDSWTDIIKQIEQAISAEYSDMATELTTQPALLSNHVVLLQKKVDLILKPSAGSSLTLFTNSSPEHDEVRRQFKVYLEQSQQINGEKSHRQQSH